MANEPAHMPSLRAIGGIIGLLRGYSAMHENGQRLLTAECIRNLSDLLETEYNSLWRLLVDNDGDQMGE